ncbi:zinc-ribbon domain containing protein [Bacillus rubiinfantis]|nr:zinc-ribbon domain containing protein [Bacillus rubiinfantis]
MKCWIYGERFTFTIGEQKFYKSKGVKHSKKCNDCLNERDGEFFY